MSDTARVQYVFLDVVGFTKDRSVEAQSDVVAKLNSLVTDSLATTAIASDRTILLPTGDGMAIALVDVPGVDIHLQLALHILRLIAEHNGAATDAARRFEVRIGINENIDNVLNDINGRRNVAGAGISMAQRIMDKADGGQVLVGSAVFEVLRQRESYMSSFRAFTARGKHGLTFPLYQFLSKNPGLNVSVPSAFVVRRQEPSKLSMFAAYYIAHAVANREFLLSRKSDPTRNCSAAILLSFLAEDSENASSTPVHEEPTPHTWRAGLATFEEQYRYYEALDLWVLVGFAESLKARVPAVYAEYFDESGWETSTWLVKPSGIQKLLAEWPQIAAEFGITTEGTG